jgi:sulfur carrier protein ThiS adenylyltransferase
MNTFEQGLLRYLKEDQLKKIQSAKIGIGGAGGLGSNAAMILIRSGFKHLEIIDKDTIDASNLNRQQYYVDEIGLPKATILKKRLLAINPEADITVHQTEWSEKNASKFFKNCRIIVEAFDQADWKYKFVDYYQDKAEYVVCGNGMAGLLEKKPMQVKRIGNIFMVGDYSTDTRQGHPPMAPRVTACAAMMAEVVLDVTLGLKK